MSPKALFSRRPSASMAVSLLALFIALGGVGWAASQLPPNSVGTAQLRNGAVTNRKIRDGAVGNRKIADGAVGNFKLSFGAVSSSKIQEGAVGLFQVNPDQVQARVVGKCSDAGTIGAIDRYGNVTCNSTFPGEFGTTSGAVAVGATPTPIASEPLPAVSSYLVFANPNAVITPAQTSAGTQVEVDCTLAVSGSPGATLTRSLSVEIGPAETPQAGTMALALPVGVLATATATVNCSTIVSGGPAPVVTVQSSINAIQTAQNL